MKKRLIRILYGSYLGGSISMVFNVGILDWRWWIVLLPTVILAELGFRSENKD
jgi:hypothetical protein